MGTGPSGDVIPPKFKFTIVASFQDPLTRQIAESVRIEKGGENILNSKSEYSRCRVPRLRIDMEGWQKNKTKEMTTIVQERVVETATMSQEDGQLIDGLEETEATARRLDFKRKGEENKSSKE